MMAHLMHHFKSISRNPNSLIVYQSFHRIAKRILGPDHFITKYAKHAANGTERSMHMNKIQHALAPMAS